MKLLFALIVAVILACAVLSTNAHKPFEPRIDAAPAAMIVCNPQPTPDLIRWHRSKESKV